MKREATLFERGREVRDDALELRDALERAVGEGRRLLQAQLVHQPYATLVAAAGVGYVLGGGMPPAVVRVMAAMGGRMAVERMLLQIVMPRGGE